MVIVLDAIILYCARRCSHIMLKNVTLYDARRYQNCIVLKSVNIILLKKNICIYTKRC